MLGVGPQQGLGPSQISANGLKRVTVTRQSASERDTAANLKTYPSGTVASIEVRQYPHFRSAFAQIFFR